MFFRTPPKDIPQVTSLDRKDVRENSAPIPSKSGASAGQPEDVKEIQRGVGLSFLSKGRYRPTLSKKEHKKRVLDQFRARSSLKTAKADSSTSEDSSPGLTKGLLGSEDSAVLYGSLVDPQAVYHFRLVLNRTYTASGGVWNSFTNLDPSLFQEWSSINALFDEYKINRCVVNFLPMTTGALASVTGLEGAVYPYVYAAFNLGAIGLNPGSFNAVAECPNSRAITLSPGMLPSYYSYDSGVIGPSFLWQAFTGAALNPFCGAYGEFWLYGGSQGAGDVLYAFFQLDFMVRMRS